MTAEMIEGWAFPSVCCEEGDSRCLLDETLEGLVVTEDVVCPSESWLCERLYENGSDLEGLEDKVTGFGDKGDLVLRSSSFESEASTSTPISSSYRG